VLFRLELQEASQTGQGYSSRALPGAIPSQKQLRTRQPAVSFFYSFLWKPNWQLSFPDASPLMVSAYPFRFVL
jgi:hypothetical protein